MLQRTSLPILVLTFCMASGSLLAAENTKQAKRGQAPPPNPPVPELMEIGPDSADATVVTAVGAVTTLDFGDEKPLSLIGGLHEQLGVEQSAPNHPGNLIHLRPSQELAGKITNVKVETDHGRVSFFVKTIFSPHGAERGTFHSEVRIRTAGHVSHLQGLTERITALEEQVQQIRAAERAKAAEMKKQYDTDVAQQFERGAKEVLDRLALLPVGGKQKRQPPQKVGDIVLTPVASAGAGTSRVLLVDVENRAAVARPFNVSDFVKDVRYVRPEVRELQPRQKARIAVMLRRAADAGEAAKVEPRPVPANKGKQEGGMSK